MEKILIYPTAVLMAFLPLRYRKRCNLEDSLEMRGAAVVSGVAQCVVCSGLYAFAFKSQIMDAMRQIGMMILNNQTGDIDPLQIRLATGVFGMANFVLQPLNLLIGYMLLEGMV